MNKLLILAFFICAILFCVNASTMNSLETCKIFSGEETVSIKQCMMKMNQFENVMMTGDLVVTNTNATQVSTSATTLMDSVQSSAGLITLSAQLAVIVLICLIIL
jgi:hypothetical protein